MVQSRRQLLQGTLAIGAISLASGSNAARSQEAGKAPVGVPGYAASSANAEVAVINLDLLEQEAKAKIPPFGYAFVSGGAGDEWTMRENRRAFEDFPILTRRLTGVDSKSINLQTTILGTSLPSPIMVAPMGAHGLVHKQAEVATASGTGAAGTLYQCSGASHTALEEIARATQGPKWFQLYFNNDIGVTRSLLQRAKNAGYSAIILTVDALGPGSSDRVRKLRQPFPKGLTFANHDPRFGGTGDFGNQKLGLTWDDIGFCREVSGLPVVVKGVMRAEDAVRAVNSGAAAVQVSNHGGRQIDGVPASVTVLPMVADAVAGRVPILLDGGIRRGVDVLKALALGANAVAIGRPILYGLGVGGAPGVKSVLDFLNADLKFAMLLAGVGSVTAVDRASIFARAKG